MNKNKKNYPQTARTTWCEYIDKQNLHEIKICIDNHYVQYVPCNYVCSQCIVQAIDNTEFKSCWEKLIYLQKIDLFFKLINQ